MNVLIIEDDPILAKGLELIFKLEGYTIDSAKTLKEARQKCKVSFFSLIMLDLNLPDGFGVDFLSDYRKINSQTPIIILTAKTDEDTVVLGLQSGANDFVKKPFSQRELMARVSAVLRKPIANQTLLKVAQLSINLDQRTVKYKDLNIDLNRREFDILVYFAQRVDKVVTRNDLLAILDKEGEIFDRTIDSHISHLRSKLKQIETEEIKISSVYGVGYRLELNKNEN